MYYFYVCVLINYVNRYIITLESSTIRIRSVYWKSVSSQQIIVISLKWLSHSQEEMNHYFLTRYGMISYQILFSDCSRAHHGRTNR